MVVERRKGMMCQELLERRELKKKEAHVDVKIDGTREI